MNTKPKLTPDETAVLSVLMKCSRWDENFMNFAGISDELDRPLDRRRVRLACRKLKRKGLAEFSAGLSNSAGEFAGAGYAVSPAGITLMEAQQ